MRVIRPALEHDMFALLHQVAGKLPDQTVATARAKLAAGNIAEVARDIAEAFVRSGLHLRRWQCAVLVRAGAPASVLTIAAQAGPYDKERRAASSPTNGLSRGSIECRDDCLTAVQARGNGAWPAHGGCARGPLRSAGCVPDDHGG